MAYRFTSVATYAIMLASNREADAMNILLLVALTFVAGVVGGVVIAEQLDLETPERRYRDRQAKRREKRLQRRERNW
jgi:hypothetical protein